MIVITVRVTTTITIVPQRKARRRAVVIAISGAVVISIPVARTPIVVITSVGTVVVMISIVSVPSIVISVVFAVMFSIMLTMMSAISMVVVISEAEARNVDVHSPACRGRAWNDGDRGYDASQHQNLGKAEQFH